jgi:hypothetical protein
MSEGLAVNDTQLIIQMLKAFQQENKALQQENKAYKAEVLEALRKLEHKQQRPEPMLQSHFDQLLQDQQKQHEEILTELKANTAKIRTICEWDEEPSAETATEIASDSDDSDNQAKEIHVDVSAARKISEESTKEVEDAECKKKEQEEAENKEEELQETAEKEGEELQRRQREREAANKQSNETSPADREVRELGVKELEHTNYEVVNVNQESSVPVILQEVATPFDIAPPLNQASSSHHLENSSDKHYSEVCQGLFKRHNQEKVFHKILRTIWRKVKHKTKTTKDRNKQSSRKRRCRAISNSRSQSEVEFHKLCRGHLCQQISNPYRKEVRDEGGTVKVVPLGK